MKKAAIISVVSACLLLAGCQSAPAASPQAATPTSPPVQSASPSPSAVPSSTAQAPTATPLPEGVTTISYDQSIGADLPVYRFELDLKDNGNSNYTALEIRIVNTQDNTLIQTITPAENSLTSNDPLSEAYPDQFKVEDMNFDGYADMRLMEFMPAVPNTPYYYWLWDAQTGQFVDKTADYGRISSPEFNQEKQQIYSYQRHYAAAYTEWVYEIIDGKPQPVKADTSEALFLDQEQALQLLTGNENLAEDAQFHLVRTTTAKRENGAIKVQQDQLILQAQSGDQDPAQVYNYALDDAAINAFIKSNFTDSFEWTADSIIRSFSE